MPDFVALQDIQGVLSRRILLPTVVMWNRLEGRPRRKDFERALRAEIRDALWMLAKQWQVGEFRGDDAGSPVHARLVAEAAELGSFQPGDGEVRAFDPEVPLETTVEQRRIPFATRQHLLSLDIRLLMGRQWLKMVAAVGDFRDGYIQRYKIRRPDPTVREDAPFCAHVDVWQHVNALAGRAMDGGALYFYLIGGSGRHAYDGVTVPDSVKDDIDELGARFVAWFDGLFVQPAEGNDAWLPEQLEYRFATATATATATAGAPGGKVMRAREYYHGRLDWYNLDLDPATQSLGEPEQPATGESAPAVHDITRAFLPTAIRFEGMPHTRWWSFEEGKTNFGDIAPDTNELGKLLLMEFGLIYANDWFLVPLTVPAGSVVTVKGLAVANVFGERTWIEPAGQGPEQSWQRWRMFTLATQGTGTTAADTSLVMLPTVGKTLEERLGEEVALVRDEVANMVWGIESLVPLATGAAKRGREAALELRAHLERIVQQEAETNPPPAPFEFKAPVRYEIMNTVPEHWIPFIPVHRDNDNREIQLQRASLPRIFEGDPTTEAIKPRTVLLRHGLDDQSPQRYFLHEEEVPRTGVRVYQAFQRTRWYGGRVLTWLGVRKTTGRGEGHSGLAFDQLRPTGTR